MDASLWALGRMLEFPPPPVVPEVNVAAGNEWGRSSAFRPVPREPVTPEIEAELTRLTRLDLVIYDTARTRLAHQHDTLPGGPLRTADRPGPAPSGGVRAEPRPSAGAAQY